MATTNNWMETHVRQVHMDFHMPEFPRDAIRSGEGDCTIGAAQDAGVGRAVLVVTNRCRLAGSRCCSLRQVGWQVGNQAK